MPCKAHPEDMLALRALLHEAGQPVHGLPDQEILAKAAWQVACGGLCLLEPPLRVIRAIPRAAPTVAPVRSSSALTPSGLLGSRLHEDHGGPAQHWIEIELVGEDDLPIPGEEYCITTPAGEQVRGHLDRDGRARVDHLPTAGMCRVSFPALDQDAWDFARSRPPPAATSAAVR
ncbi:hypothetical protein [Eleftheria terrae]|uniref:hypothetical protein n=1 Tax=Eleftheria terrae TaxID=1597781 RepID=UPI00263B4875|nr:hypothetical protein [Eleftheria terrae]WKB55800.1 hypothetical protein N7L95_27355 [Eleftheria terrae]